MPKIARELNVDVIVEGSVLLLGDRVRLTAQLIHGATDRHFWAESYERNLSDVLALQGELAKIIAQQIKVSLTAKEEKRLSSAHSVKPEAYEAYLKGRFHLNKRTEEGMKKSAEYFEKAIEIDPSYAAAQAGLADSYILLGDYMFIPPKVIIPKGKEAAKKALEIDDSLAEAHNSLAYASFIFDRDWASAEREFNRAIELNPNYATAHQWYSEFLASMRRFDEAIKEIGRAQELDPLSLIINTMSGRTFYYAREYDRAIEQFRKTLEIDPDFLIAYGDLGRIYIQKKMYEEALAAEKKGNNEAWIGIAYAKMGKFDEARMVLENLIERSKRSYVPHLFYRIAILYFSLGKNDEGFKWLDAAYEDRDSELLRINVEPIFDGVRSDPQFKAMLKRLGLE
jgi:tetratricopeptide (TPR) repeat protein